MKVNHNRSIESHNGEKLMSIYLYTHIHGNDIENYHWDFKKKHECFKFKLTQKRNKK